jgi:hypothetical protein
MTQKGLKSQMEIGSFSRGKKGEENCMKKKTRKRSRPYETK